MPINTLLDRVRLYVDSLLYPLTLALLAITIWALPLLGSWIVAGVFALLSFLPLVSKDGRGYLPLLLMTLIVSNTDISFDSFQPYLYLLFIAFMVSLVLYIVLHHLDFHRGDLFYPLLLLFFLFTISYLYNSSLQGVANRTGVFYLILFFGALVLYSLLCTVLGKKETFPYFSKTITFFALAIVCEIVIYCFRNEWTIADSDFTLGWSYTTQTASTLLCLSLPFFSYLVYQKKFIFILGELFVIAAIILLSADSGLICLIFAVIPLILITFRSYGKYYSYISLVSIVVIGTTFAVLLALNTRFNTRVITALQALSLFDEPSSWRKTLFDTAVENIVSNPVTGTSLLSFCNRDGTLTLSSNTILSTLVMGGSLGLVSYLIYECKLYYVCLKKKASSRLFFFVFLLMIELIGLIDNTIYNIAILLFVLIANSCYQMSNRPDDVLIHDSYYRNYPIYEDKKTFPDY